MNAKKLMVGSVTAVTLTLFTVAVDAQQPAVPQEDTAQAPIARQEEGARPDAQATLIGIDEGGVAQFRRSGHRSAVEKPESSFGRWSHEAHQAGSRTSEHARSHR